MTILKDQPNKRADTTYNDRTIKTFLCDVLDVVLDEADNVCNGKIIIDPLSNDDIIKAVPLNPFNYTLPFINEKVLVVNNSENNRWYYVSVANVFLDEEDVEETADYVDDDYNKVMDLNKSISQHVDPGDGTDDGNPDALTIGLTAIANDSILPSALHEGDTILQGRAGQYIKLTSKNELNEAPWSFDGEDGKPVISIRITDNNVPDGDKAIEDPTTDNAFIYMLSDQSIDLGDIEYSPENPSIEAIDSYVGSHVVIGSNRLSFVSKEDDISLTSANLIGLSTAKWQVDLDILMDQVKALAEEVEALTTAKATFTTGVGPTGPATNAGNVSKIVSDISGMEQ